MSNFVLIIDYKKDVLYQKNQELNELFVQFDIHKSLKNRYSLIFS
jgi:hypothetical protein